MVGILVLCGVAAAQGEGGGDTLHVENMSGVVLEQLPVRFRAPYGTWWTPPARPRVPAPDWLPPQPSPPQPGRQEGPRVWMLALPPAGGSPAQFPLPVADPREPWPWLPHFDSPLRRHFPDLDRLPDACRPDWTYPAQWWLLANLPPHAHGEVSLRSSPPRPLAEGNAGPRSVVVLAGGRLRFDSGRITLGRENGPALIGHLGCYGWTSFDGSSPASPDEAARAGVPGFNTDAVRSAAGTVDGGQVYDGLVTAKWLGRPEGEFAAAERLLLFRGSHDLIYHLKLSNSGPRPLYLADCDGVIHGRWPKDLLPLTLRTSGGLDGGPLSGNWLGVPASGAAAEHGPWTVLTHDGGPSLAIARLAGGFQTWAFTTDGFWLYLTDPDGHRPIRLDPGQSLTWSLLITSVGEGGEAAADVLQRRCVYFRRPPVLVSHQGTVLAEGSPVGLAAGARPALLTPFDGQPLTDRAAFFTWASVPGAMRFELQLAREADFAGAVTYRAPALDAQQSVWMPPQLPEPGAWHWRVRAIGEDAVPGDWSEPRSVTLQPSAPARPPARAPSSAQPLFLLHAPSDIATAWTIVPADLRPFCALRLEAGERGLDLRALCRTAHQQRIPLVVQCSGPGGGVYGEVYNQHYGRQSLSELEWAFRNCPEVIGALVCEQNFHLRSDPSSAEYVRRLADLCAAHGRLLIFADGHWGSFAWLKMGEDPQLLDIFRRHPRTVVPLWKMNCSQVPLTIHGAVLGYWAAGISDQFGVEPEDWYWFEAGFSGLGEGTGRINTGRHELLPDSLWGGMILTGLASGAACYCLEPYTGMWRYDHPDQPTEAWTRVIAPLLRAIARRRLIPDRQTALGAVKVAVQTRAGDLAFDPDYGAFRSIYDTLYGIRHRSELIPDRGRYGIVPLLPPLAADARLPAGMQRATTSDLATPGAVRAVFDPLYPPAASGDGFVRWIGDTLVALNSRENEDAAQSFEIPIGLPGLTALGGTLGPHAYVVGQRRRGRLWLQVNGRPERAAKLRIRAARRPSLLLPPGCTAQWDELEHRLTLTIAHRDGAVELVLGEDAGPAR